MIWFDNLLIYRLAADHALSAESIQSCLEKRPFVPCGSMDMESHGWIQPARFSPDLVYSQSDSVLVTLRVETKVLPAAVIKDELDYRVQQIEAAESRKCGRKEQRELKDRIIEELTPRAFTRSTQQRAIIDLERKLVIVNAASAAKAEFLLSTLRETLGSLPTRIIDTKISPCAAMTDWLGNETPDAFSLGQSAILRVPGDEGAKARFDRQVMDTAEIRQHLSVGMIATSLSLSYGERLTFKLSEDHSVKQLAMLDVLKDELKDMDAETQDDLFKSQYALLIGELRGFIPVLFNALGGEQADLFD